MRITSELLNRPHPPLTWSPISQQSVGFEKSWILYGDLYYNHIIRFSIAVTAVEKKIGSGQYLIRMKNGYFDGS